eukprot:gene12140-12278_t
MVMRSELTNQIPANATALKQAKILLPEGASKNYTFAWVCDARGGLYLSVNKEHMISCGSGTINLAQTLKIKGAKETACPDTKKACPGNTAVRLFAKYANTAEQFKAKQGQIGSDEPVEAPAPPAAAPAPNATKAAAPKAIKAADAKPEKSPLRKLLRALFAESDKESLDAAAVVEELPGGPKPLIEVTTSIQPLTDEEASSVLGTTSSPYFIETYRKTLQQANLTATQDLETKITEPAKEFVWPEPPKPVVKKAAATSGFGPWCCKF